MVFKRSATLPPLPPHHVLTARMAGIGFQFAGTTPDTTADIEHTLLHASVVGIEQDDFRTLGLLTTWLGIHHPRVHADRLLRVLDSLPADTSVRTKTYWHAVAMWLGDARLLRHRFDDVGAVALLQVGNDFQLARHGEDERFIGGPLRVPRGVLRDRASDVMTPAQLVAHHVGYRLRVLLGPSYRADVFTLLARDPNMSVVQLAEQAQCAIGTASEVAKDFRLLSNVDTPFLAMENVGDRLLSAAQQVTDTHSETFREVGGA
jgi:hypothetical protein